MLLSAAKQTMQPISALKEFQLLDAYQEYLRSKKK